MKTFHPPLREPDGGRQPDEPEQGSQRDEGRRRADQPVADAMSSPALTVPGRLPLSEALLAMVRSGRRHLVVVDDGGFCLGVLADRVIAAAWAHEPDGLTRRPVRAVLDPEPAVVGPGARVLDAARLMRSAGVDAVAVVDAAGCPAGIVTGSDLIALLAG